MTRFAQRLLLAAAVFLSIVIAACGGGGSSAVNALISMTGTAVDAPIANATITITSIAPLNVAGAQTIGTITAGSNGAFTVSVTLPGSGVPVFANAADPTNAGVILNSYLGQSDTLAAAGSLTSSNTPDLDITPVTTAALAVYAQLNGGSYAALSPATYATTLQSYGSDILAIAAAIKAVGDKLCAPAVPVSSTTSLAAQIAGQANLSSGTSTTIGTAAGILGGNCPTVLASLPQQISSDPMFGPQLYIGEVNDSATPGSTASVSSVLPAGSYALQGVFADTNVTSSGVAVAPNPASVFADAAITVGADGQITSTDNNVSGFASGNLITLTVVNGAQSYTLSGKVGAIQTLLTSGGTAYAMQAGGTNSASNALTTFEAVIAPAGTAPVWNGVAAPAAATTQHNVTCAAGAFPVRMDIYGQGVGGVSLGECITEAATGWTLATAASSALNFGEYFSSSPATISFSTPTWALLPAQPFILGAANAGLTVNGTTTTGNIYFVMGTGSAIYATAAGNALINIETGGGSSSDTPTRHAGDGNASGTPPATGGDNNGGASSVPPTGNGDNNNGGNH
jgi:hypothetical protein